MLIEFQQALADLTASPRLCNEVSANPELLRRRYELTDMEARRLRGMVNSPGMTSNCVLYRANRVAPLALNLPRLCRLLRADLRDLLTEYWEQCPSTDVNFLVESARFCEFLQEKCRQGYELSEEARTAFDAEHLDLCLRLLASQTVLK